METQRILVTGGAGFIGTNLVKELRSRGHSVMMDADGQYHAHEIPRPASWAMNGNADLVIGSRFLEKNGHIPIYREVGQKTLDLFTNIGSSQKVTDSQSGYRALSRKALDYIDFYSGKCVCPGIWYASADCRVDPEYTRDYCEGGSDEPNEFKTNNEY